MKTKISGRWLWVTFVVTAIIIFLVFFVFLLKPTPVESVPETAINSTVNVFLPVNFKIPTLNIDARILAVGLTPQGAMDAPTGPNEVGWLDLSVSPGLVGTAVMDGHSGYKDNIPAVFDNLYKLKKGDKIFVENEEHTVITFVVRESREYNPNTSNADVFSSNDGLSHLNLITCSGIWNSLDKTHSKRLVLFADKE